MNCTTCIYFVKVGTQMFPTVGTCRRFPPTNFRSHKASCHSDFPEVSSEIWCGEHQDFKLEAAETILPRLRKIREE